MAEAEGLRVIGAGFGRTGTHSLQSALETLGLGPCHHMRELMSHTEQAPTWQAAYRGEQIDWPRFLASYRATVDWPACTFYRELMDAFPDAKVLLSVRDPARWYESAYETIYQLNVLCPAWLRRVVPPLRAVLGTAGPIWEKTFGGRFEDKAHAIAVFEAHNAEVQRTVPPARLLVYEVSQGWAPLCEFLGVPVPDEPFPRLNDREQMLRRVRMMRRARVAGPVILAGLVLLLVTLVILLFAR
jgi:Sulfotransferase domain